MDIKLPFGIKDGKLVHISEIPVEENGLKCLCLCPSCGEKLIARIGTTRVHHFAHRNAQCASALETALHLFCKEVLEQNKRIKLPSLSLKHIVTHDEEDNEKTNYKYIRDIHEIPYYEEEIEIVKEMEIHFDKVESEKRLDDVKPDIILYKNSTPLLIEIAVTQYIDEKKLEKIKKLDISAIEIDLDQDKIDFYNFDKQKIEKLIIESTDCKQWIYNRKAEEEKLRLAEEEKKQAAQWEIQQQINEKKKQRKLALEKKQKEAKIRRIGQLMAKENYAKKLEKFDSEIVVDTNWIRVSSSLGVRLNTLPEFLNIAVNGEMAIDCDRRIWQSMIYQKFINCRKGKEVKVFSIVNWVKKYSGLPINKDLEYTQGLGINVSDLTDAIYNYLRKLEEYKLLSCFSNPHKYYTEFRIKYCDLKTLKGLTKTDILNLITKIEEEERNARFWGKPNNDKHVETKVDSSYKTSISATATIYGKVGTCISCGKTTDDWIIYYGDGTCKCRQCNYQGNKNAR